MPLAVDSLGRASQSFSWGDARELATAAAVEHTTALAGTTVAVRLHATQDCYVKIGIGADATSGGTYVKAGVPEIVGVPIGGARVSARRVSADGSLNITELS